MIKSVDAEMLSSCHVLLVVLLLPAASLCGGDGDAWWSGIHNRMTHSQLGFYFDSTDSEKEQLLANG